MQEKIFSLSETKCNDHVLQKIMNEPLWSYRPAPINSSNIKNEPSLEIKIMDFIFVFIL
jgi:hypothetical protein